MLTDMKAMDPYFWRNLVLTTWMGALILLSTGSAFQHMQETNDVPVLNDTLLFPYKYKTGRPDIIVKVCDYNSFLVIK